MSFTPSNARTFPANTGLGIKLTPSNSPYPQTPRSPKKKSLYDPELSLTRIIGTTVNSPTGFDSLSSARIFAYVAGAAVVVVHILKDLSYTQRFFRARPTAVPVTPGNISSGVPSTPTNNAGDSRSRVFASLRDSANGYSPSTPKISRIDWNDSPSSRTWTSRERIKAATCLSISRDGRFLAVGECGYAPRVLIFSLHESSDAPLAILNEHRYGVRAVAFSPDGLLLATLGFETDGFLYLWSIDRSGAAKLHSTNKCTSFIKGMVWVGNNSLVTFGTRHIKTWRAEDNNNSSPHKQRFASDGSTPTPIVSSLITKTLAGRNCLLGSLVDATFTAAAAVSDLMALISSERGDLCLLDHTNGQKLINVGHAGFDVTCVAVDVERRLVKVAGRDSMSKLLNLDELLNSVPRTDLEIQDSPRDSSSIGGSIKGHLCAVAFVDSLSITVDSQHTIAISLDEDLGPVEVTGHTDPILGVRLLDQPNAFDAQFCTWDSSGNILFWDLDGVCKSSMQTEIEQSLHGNEEDNQCLVVRISSAAQLVILGDRKGCLSILETSSRSCIFKTKAHGSEIQDIAVYEGKMTLIASCSRDRTIQLFRKVEGGESWTLSLVQTMDEHQANISNILFSDNGDRLISCSSDRAIQIREIASREVNGQEVIAALPLRVVTLKATPVSMCLTSGDQALVISMMDRTVATYDLSTGKLVSSFRSTDFEGNDAVIMDALVVGKPALLPGRPTILAGISSLDKSIRIYDANTGNFLDREWGHTSSVTDVSLMETSERTSLISTATDGTIMIWDLSSRVPELLEPFETLAADRDLSPPKDSLFARPPLRRVLSRAELAEFQRPSPVSTPTGRSSPPRPLRRKTSRYSMATTQSPKLSLPPVPAMPPQFADNADFSSNRLRSPRTRSRSPPSSPKAKANRRPSLADLRGRPKSASNVNSEFGSLNMATEQVCRTLRAYRKKLSTAETVREDLLKDLDLELRLTAKALGEKTLKTKAISEKVLAGLLDEYSDRLVSIFDEKLRLGLSSHLSAAETSNGDSVGLRRISSESFTQGQGGDSGSGNR